MARNMSSVRPATFALALSTLGPAWASRLEAENAADDMPGQKAYPLGWPSLGCGYGRHHLGATRSQFMAPERPPKHT